MAASVTSSRTESEGLVGCSVTPDPVYNGSFLDCSNLQLTQTDLPRLPYFAGVSSLDISDNNIGYFPDSAFVRFHDLKCLMCTRCQLDWVGNYSLKGLDALEVLRLDYNNLDMVMRSDNEQPPVPSGLFRHVPNLKQLHVDHNGQYTISPSGYSPYLPIFGYLTKLTHLSIDSFKSLVIGEEFLVFTELYSLNISCQSLRTILNDSLKGFRNSSVQLFQLTDGNEFLPIQPLGLDVFENLPNVSYLNLKQIRVGNPSALRMLKPLVGRKIFTIRFETVFSPAFSGFNMQVSDTILTTKEAQYLRNISLSNFLWYNSDVYSLDYEVPFSKVWEQSLRSLVFESDALTQTTLMILFRAMLMKNIELIAYSAMNNGFRNQFLDYPVDGNVPSLVPFDIKPLSKFSTSNRVPSISALLRDEHDMFVGGRDSFQQHANKYTGGVNSNKQWRMKDSVHNAADDSHGHGNYTITVPPKLRTFVMDSTHYFKLVGEYELRENKIETIIGSNTVGYVQLHGILRGLENLTTLGLQGSRHLDLSLEFLDAFPNLKNLDLAKTSTRPEFYQTYTTRIVEKLTLLEYFNLAENSLQRLPTGIFNTNNLLKYINLATNRLSSIPFDLELTPILHTLDLRGNSFVHFSTDDRAAIDKHILSVRNFSILFGDNELSCACNELPFIVWLQQRRHHFDGGGDYPCIADNGTLTNTAFYFRDTKAFWRECRGSYYLMLSAILACSLVAVYLGLFLGMKNKTAIISKVMQVVVPGFRLKTRRDFRFDVCIGYADQDGTYVRNVLLRYLEDTWGLSTFVHQRDLRQDPLEMSNALRDSWRCLLLVTEEFLYNYHMAHNVMKVASFFVSPWNPRSVVVVLEESVRHRVPDYVLQVVHEDNILVLPALDEECFLDYQTTEFLRTRLT